MTLSEHDAIAAAWEAGMARAERRWRLALAVLALATMASMLPYFWRMLA